MRVDLAEMEFLDKRVDRALLDLVDRKADLVFLDDRENLVLTDVPDQEERGENKA